MFLIPYDQIDHIAFMIEIKESEFLEHFADLRMPAVGSVATNVAVELPPVPLTPIAPVRAEDLPLTPITPGVAPASRSELTIKSEVLERFRNRNGNGTGKPTGG